MVVSTEDDKLRHFSGDSEPKTAVPEGGETLNETPEIQGASGNVDPRDKKGRFRKGFSGNPGGGPTGPKTMTTKLRQLLREPDPNNPGMSRGDRLIQMAYVHAAKGNFQFFKEIFERNDGKVPDKVEAVLSEGWDMEYGDAELEPEPEPMPDPVPMPGPTEKEQQAGNA